MQLLLEPTSPVAVKSLRKMGCQCPGRVELGDSQELNYPAIMLALVDIGYEGYVGQEFVPTRPPMEGLREAVTLCDV